MDFSFFSIDVETVIGENTDFDKAFFEYLDEYSISYTFVDNSEMNDKVKAQWPLVKYTGGPIALRNMLFERFGMTPDEIIEYYPELIKEQKRL